MMPASTFTHPVPVGTFFTRWLPLFNFRVRIAYSESRWFCRKGLLFESACCCVWCYSLACFIRTGKSRDSFPESWGPNTGCLALVQVPLSNQWSISQVRVCDVNVWFSVKFSLVGTSPVLHHSWSVVIFIIVFVTDAGPCTCLYTCPALSWF